jgi:glycosyltransferase involved in cell wall biosynthesis
VTDIPKTLFLSRGNKAPAWYRCALPALALGADWTCYGGTPPNVQFDYGRIDRKITLADIPEYEVVVIQQPRGPEWLTTIREWQRRGVVVLADIDDWIRGIRKKQDHDFNNLFGRKTVEAYELCLRAVDGIICSTPWLAERFAGLNKNTFVCRNGIDLKRYALTIPERDHVAVGWSGATGHKLAMQPWLAKVAEVMREHDDLRFVSVGQGFAKELAPEFGPQRCVAVPFTLIDTYPASMTLYDVALAPAGEGSFYRGKSDLRWLESSALGQPLIADPTVYPDIEHGVTGFHASTPAEMAEILRELVADEPLRRRVGAAAKAYVTEHRSAQVAAAQWADVLRQVGSTALAA